MQHANSLSREDDSVAKIDYARVFPDGPFRFHMGFEKGDIAAYLAHTNEHEEICSERRQQLEDMPDEYVALLPDGEPLFHEMLDTVEQAEVLPADLLRAIRAMPTAAEQCRELSKHLEPDFILMRPDAEEKYVVVGGCVCFPSNWSIPDKMGKTMSEVHGPVPGLNEQLERKIDQYLVHLKPGAAWQRTNWSLNRTNQRNNHPLHAPKNLDEHTPAKDIWIRYEDQALIRLQSGVLFCFRLTTERITDLMRHERGRTGFERELQQMPLDMAQYKQIDGVRSRLIGLLQSVNGQASTDKI